MPRSSVAFRAVPLAAAIALAALALVALRPDPREVVLRVAAGGFVVGLGVAAILAVLVPLGWVAFAWRWTVGRRRTPRRVGRFLLLMALTIAVVGAVAAVVVVYWTPPSPVAPPEA